MCCWLIFSPWILLPIAQASAIHSAATYQPQCPRNIRSARGLHWLISNTLPGTGPLSLWLQPSIQPRKALPSFLPQGQLLPHDCPFIGTYLATQVAPLWSSMKGQGPPSSVTSRALPFSSSSLLRLCMCPHNLAMLGEGEGRGERGAVKGTRAPSLIISSASQRRSAQRTDQKPPVFREKKGLETMER